MNKKIKNILIFVIGIIVGSTICVIGSNVINANQVGLNSSKTTKTNIQDAVDELYTFTNRYKKDNVEMAKIGDTYKAIVYLDPTDLNKNCNKDNSVSTTGTKTGCMKWYVYSETYNNYNLILDHNTTAKISSWNLNTAQSQLNNLVSENYWQISPRLISATEVANIIGNNSWTVTNGIIYFDSNCPYGSCTIGKNKYAWLFDYTPHCSAVGCNIIDNTTDGYWTSSDYSDNNHWGVGSHGNLYNASNTYSSYGIRPVITISKS